MIGLIIEFIPTRRSKETHGNEYKQIRSTDAGWETSDLAAVPEKAFGGLSGSETDHDPAL